MSELVHDNLPQPLNPLPPNRVQAGGKVSLLADCLLLLVGWWLMHVQFHMDMCMKLCFVCMSMWNCRCMYVCTCKRSNNRAVAFSPLKFSSLWWRSHYGDEDYWRWRVAQHDYWPRSGGQLDYWIRWVTITFTMRPSGACTWMGIMVKVMVNPASRVDYWCHPQLDPHIGVRCLHLTSIWWDSERWYW